MNPALMTTAQYWWSVDQMASLWHIAPKTVRALLQPHRGRCHLARRGRHPRLLLWAPIEVVRMIDRERQEFQRPTLRVGA